MLTKPFAVSIRAALPVLLVAVFFLCPLVVWSVQSNDASGVLLAANRVLAGTGLLLGRVTDDNSPPRTAIGIRVEPASVEVKIRAERKDLIAVRHVVAILDSVDPGAAPWATVTDGPDGYRWRLDAAAMPPGGLLLRLNGQVWPLKVTPDGLDLGSPSWSAALPMMEAPGVPEATSRGGRTVLVFGRAKWFNDVSASRLLGSGPSPAGKGTDVMVEDVCLGSGFEVRASVAEGPVPVAALCVRPLDSDAFWRFQKIDFASEPGAPPIATLNVPGPAVAGDLSEIPCVLDLYRPMEAPFRSMCFSAGTHDYVLRWCTDGSDANVVLLSQG